VPANSYRLQISADFTLHDATARVPYLRALGVDWLYLSPLLESASGSSHGYDVVDHGRVDAARGGAEGLRALADAAHAAGLGVLVDIVPNHMGVADARANSWWRDVLARGRDSQFADFFDIDWAAGDGRVNLPVLGAGADELDRLRVDDGELVYYDHRFPIAEGTGAGVGSPREVHDRQHYRLVPWTEAPQRLNYRRFFAVNDLAALRVEDPRVFDASHREIVRWVDEGLVDGIRVDHPDGLRDPGAYLERLSAAIGGAPIWVEKIVEGDEQLPPHWPVAGTTGYDALGLIERVFIDGDGEAELTRVTDEAAGGPLRWAELAAEQKRAVARGALHPDVARIARELGEPGDATEEALVELAAALPIYRTYLPFGRAHLDAAAAQASVTRPELADAIARVHALLADPANPGAARFQQTSGMIMAKGVEDSAFYRFPRLTSLNEVGGDPSWFAVGPGEFHERQRQRLERLPDAMTTLTTHDTKRSEDTRARISALAEIPGEWAQALAELRGLAPTGDALLEQLVWQAVVGAWPASRERLRDYALKAAREAGVSTTWTAPDEAFESRLTGLVDAAFDDERVRRVIEGLSARITPAGWSNGLGAKLLQLLSPGMPDVYQGTERWDRSLVDPDNRRPVDYAASAQLLDRLDTGWQPPLDDTGAAKLLVVSRALRLRRDRPELLRGYEPVRAEGPRADHLIGFDRGAVVALATRLPLGLEAAGGWGADTLVELHGRDELTGRAFDGRVAVGDVFAQYPVALVVAA
jgi:(1->4)-alpha-D-glucan 1-alpha-D-glucosylmutase